MDTEADVARSATEDTSQRELKKLMEKYKDVFHDKLGKKDYMDVEKMDIQLRPDAAPPRQQTTCKRVPIHWHAASDEMIHQMLEDKIIKRMDSPCSYISAAKWVAKCGVSAVSGPNDLRFVTDFAKLNKDVLRSPHPFPSAQDVRKIILQTQDMLQKLICLQVIIKRPSRFKNNRICLQ